MASDKTTTWTRTLITRGTNPHHLFCSPPGPQELHWIHRETWHCGWNISSVWDRVQHPEATVRALCLTNLFAGYAWGTRWVRRLCLQKPARCQSWGRLFQQLRRGCAVCPQWMVRWVWHRFGATQVVQSTSFCRKFSFRIEYWKALGSWWHCAVTFHSCFLLLPEPFRAAAISPWCFGLQAH